MSPSDSMPPPRCSERCPNPPLPAGLSLEIAREHPRYKHLLIPGAQCEHESEHDGPHRNGLLVWHDPPLLVIGSAT